MVGRPKGTPKTGGRQKGSRNKITGTLTEAIDKAFEKAGGVDYLVAIAKSDSKAFCALLGRRLPRDTTVHADGSLTIHVTTGVPSSG